MLKGNLQRNTIRDLVTSREKITNHGITSNPHLHLSWEGSTSCGFLPHHLPLDFCKVKHVWSHHKAHKSMKRDVTDSPAFGQAVVV